MANKIYPKFKEAQLKGASNIDIFTGPVKVALVDTGTYTYSDAHDFYDDLSGVVGTPQTIANITVTNGLFDGDDVTLPSVSGSSGEALAIFIDTGSSATSRLVAYIDTGVTGLPVTPNGGDIVITWNASGIVQF